MKTKFYLRLIAIILLVTAVGLGAYAAFRSSDKVNDARVFADRTMLGGLWNAYKQTYWEASTGRTLDKQQNDITTSEGQSYTMLRSVWQSDKPTFDKTWDWTKKEIQRQDHLFSWKWGKQSDGRYGIFTNEGGQNTASDADSDIALALTMAAARWQDQTYLNEAKNIISSIWQQEVVMADGVPYLASNNLEKDSARGALINPSYFSPYAYRVFAKLDPQHDWMKLVDSSYDVLEKTTSGKLNKDHSAGLPPDWVMLNRQTGELSAPSGDAASLTTNYGYDAMRTPWRVALDYQWNNDQRALTLLQKMEFLSRQWQESGKLAAIYSHDGKTISSDEPPEIYGTSIGFFMYVHPDQAQKIYDTKLKSLYNADTNNWSQSMNYYSDNWAWFGIALYTDQLENLAAKL